MPVSHPFLFRAPREEPGRPGAKTAGR
jgi:hypothetical protein